MALSVPFINSIPAIDASKTNTIIVNVLGGDAITKFTYIIKNSNGVTVASNTVAVFGDRISETIRSFSFRLASYTLSNNNNYTITAYTETTINGEEYKSAESNLALIVCYATPSFDFKYNNGTEYVSVPIAYTVLSPELRVQIDFKTNDELSSAVLNTANLKLLGVKEDGKNELIFEGDTLYVAPLQQTVKNFSPTTNGIYKSFTLVATGTTVDGMVFESQVDNLKCSYAVADTTKKILNVENILPCSFCSLW